MQQNPQIAINLPQACQLVNIFNWNPTAQLPKSTSEWDTTNRATLSAFRTIILLAAGLNAFIAAAVLDPNGIISVDETENKPEPALT